MIEEMALRLKDGKEIVLKAPFTFRTGPKPNSVLSRGIEIAVPEGRKTSIYALVITDGKQVDHFINHEGEYDGWGMNTPDGERVGYLTASEKEKNND